MGRARDLANILSSSGNVALDSELGLSLITPTSVATTGGSNSISTTGAVSFASASAVSLNDVFSATYTSYRLIFNLQLSAASYIGTRLRVSGTDNSSSQYIYSGPTLTSGNGVENSYSNGLTTSFNEMVRVTVDTTGGIFDLLDPFATKNTIITGQSIWNRSTTLINAVTYFGVLKNDISYTGFTFFPTTGTMTGTISVYGYRK